MIVGWLIITPLATALVLALAMPTIVRRWMTPKVLTARGLPFPVASDAVLRSRAVRLAVTLRADDKGAEACEIECAAAMTGAALRNRTALMSLLHEYDVSVCEPP